MNQPSVRGPPVSLADRGVGGGAAIAAALGCWVWCVCEVAFGQTNETSTRAPQVMVLRSSGSGVGTSREAIDAALLRGLSAIAGINNVQLSPVDYEDVQLTVGCNDQSRDCLATIADTAQVSGLVVRSLRKMGAGLQLDVVYFDVSSRDAPAWATEIGDEQHLLASVPSLVRSLFGLPEVPVAVADEVPRETAAAFEPASPGVASSDLESSDTPVTASVGDDGINMMSVASIATLAAGVGTVAIGVIVWASASAAFDDYKGVAATDAASARRASAAFSDAESKATLANVLLPIGGALMVGGVVMLAVGLSDSEAESATATHVSFVPSLTGGAVMVSGAL